MAGNNHFKSYIYTVVTPFGQQNQSSFAGGELYSFPSAGTVFSPAPSGTTGGTTDVTINSIIEVLPTGLNQTGTLYYSADSVDTLNTAAT